MSFKHLFRVAVTERINNRAGETYPSDVSAVSATIPTLVWPPHSISRLDCKFQPG